MERDLQEFVSIGQVVNVLSCQLVLAREYPGRCRKTLRVETTDQLCELNIRYVIYVTNAFPFHRSFFISSNTYIYKSVFKFSHFH